MALTLAKQTLEANSTSISTIQTTFLKKLMEAFWFFLAFILFVAMGPFSAPIALIVLLQLGSQENDQAYPESVE